MYCSLVLCIFFVRDFNKIYFIEINKKNKDQKILDKKKYCIFILATPPPTQAPVTTQKPVVTTQKGIIQ